MLDKRAFWKVAAALVAAFCLLPLFSGCASRDNTDIGVKTLLDYFSSNGIKVDEVGMLRAEPAHAEFGVTAMVEGRQIGIYKYNLNNKKEKEFLQKCQERGFIGIAGHKYEKDDFLVNGSFVMIDFKANPKGERLKELFEDF